MNRLGIVVLSVSLLALPEVAFGHGDPIYITRGADGRLVTNSLNYRTEPELLSDSVYYTDLPGYSVPLGNSSVPSGAQIAVSVLSSLHFSSALNDPSAPDDNESVLYLDAFLGEGDFREVTGTTGYQTPLTVGAYATPVTSAWHEHLLYTVEANASQPGAYGVLLQLMSPNHPEILPSAPFTLIFNVDMGAENFNAVSDLMSRQLLSTGDLNFNGIVDIADLAIVADTWMSPDLKGDANHDGRVNIADIAIIAENWQNSVGPGRGGYFPPQLSMTAVPEPASWILGVTACLGLGCLRVFQRSPLKRLPTGSR